MVYLSQKALFSVTSRFHKENGGRIVKVVKAELVFPPCLCFNFQANPKAGIRNIHSGQELEELPS